MIIVSGTKRSGTSLWMQVLVAAGLPYIGERFPGTWKEMFAAANPDGFYESELAQGIYHRTNPHPRTGAYLFPDQTRWHAVKVLAPGLVRTDVAFIDRCIVTVRKWQEYAASVRRLAHILGHSPADLRSMLPPALEWWAHNFAIVRDIATRRYAAHILSYDNLLTDPERTITEVLQWLGRGDPTAAVRVVKPGHRTQRDVDDSALPADATEGLSSRHLGTFDALYDALHTGQPLSPVFVAELNRTHDELRPRLLEHEARARTAALDLMQSPVSDDH